MDILVEGRVGFLNIGKECGTHRAVVVVSGVADACLIPVSGAEVVEEIGLAHRPGGDVPGLVRKEDPVLRVLVGFVAVDVQEGEGLAAVSEAPEGDSLAEVLAGLQGCVLGWHL